MRSYVTAARASSTCSDQLVDLPNSPSLGMSMPASIWRATTSRTESSSVASYADAGGDYNSRAFSLSRGMRISSTGTLNQPRRIAWNY